MSENQNHGSEKVEENHDNVLLTVKEVVILKGKGTYSKEWAEKHKSSLGLPKGLLLQNNAAKNAA